MERVWGGRKMASKFGRTLPASKTIGESWEIVDRKNEQSIVAEGSHTGKTIRHLLENYTTEILGPGMDGSQPFPILVKWLDCTNRLSLQVHPSAKALASFGVEPKTEYWYVADCNPEAALIVGLGKGVTREQFEIALKMNKIETCLHRFPVQSGDSIFVESGCIHAIDAGNLILEIQQNSNTSFRVYDWNRVGLDGTPRPLHIEKALGSIDWGNIKPTTSGLIANEHNLVECTAFRIRKFEVQLDETVEFPSNEQARLIHVAAGKMREEYSGKILPRSSNHLQPYITNLKLTAETETATLLVTDQFSPNRTKSN